MSLTTKVIPPGTRSLSIESATYKFQLPKVSNSARHSAKACHAALINERDLLRKLGRDYTIGLYYKGSLIVAYWNRVPDFLDNPGWYTWFRADIDFILTELMEGKTMTVKVENALD